MVSNNYSRLTDEFDDLIAESDFTGLATLMAVGGGGALLAQEATQRLLPMINMPAVPSDTTGIAAAAAANLLVAAVLAAAATRFGGGGMLGPILAGLGVGATILGGINAFDALQKSGLLSEAPMGGSSSTSRSVKRARTSTASTPTSVSRSSSCGTSGRSRAAAGGASYR